MHAWGKGRGAESCLLTRSPECHRGPCAQYSACHVRLRAKGRGHGTVPLVPGPHFPEEVREVPVSSSLSLPMSVPEPQVCSCSELVDKGEPTVSWWPGSVESLGTDRWGKKTRSGLQGACGYQERQTLEERSVSKTQTWTWLHRVPESSLREPGSPTPAGPCHCFSVPHGASVLRVAARGAGGGPAQLEGPATGLWSPRGWCGVGVWVWGSA